MDIIKNNKNALLLLGLLVAALIGYNVFLGEGISFSKDTGVDGERSRQDVLTQLEQADEIELSNEIFSSPAFNTLVDKSVGIRERNVGRSNPFSPAF